ncbi:MAG: hypothetical protein ACOC2F_03690 [Bacteroidota bacterium]
METLERKKQEEMKTKSSNFYQKQYQDEFVDLWDDFFIHIAEK